MTDYRVGDLARAAGTSVRNVRVYQDRGLLPPPRREGRVGLYDDEHLARLRLIGRLLARGYTFATIGELFEAWTKGRDLGEVLGLRGALPRTGAGVAPLRLTRTEISARIGAPATSTFLQRAVDLGILVPAQNAYLVPVPALLAATARLVAAGRPPEALLELAAATRTDLSTAHRAVQTEPALHAHAPRVLEALARWAARTETTDPAEKPEFPREAAAERTTEAPEPPARAAAHRTTADPTTPGGQAIPD